MNLLALLTGENRHGRILRKNQRQGRDEARMRSEPAGRLEFLTNDPVFFDIARATAGCEPVGCFQARVYRLLPKTGHMSDWHSDDEQDRLIALSINLGRSPYQGGVLQIRRASGATMLGEVETRERRTQGGIGLRPIFAR